MSLRIPRQSHTTPENTSQAQGSSRPNALPVHLSVRFMKFELTLQRELNFDLRLATCFRAPFWHVDVSFLWSLHANLVSVHVHYEPYASIFMYVCLACIFCTPLQRELNLWVCACMRMSLYMCVCAGLDVICRSGQVCVAACTCVSATQSYAPRCSES